MDHTHIHLVLTHFPIIGAIIGIGILAYGQYSKNDSIKKVAFVTFVLMAIMTIPVFLTGEAAEETVEHLAGVSENLIEEHEELAEKAIWLMGLLGVLSIVSFFAIVKKLSFSRTISLVTLLISLATFGIFAKVGNLGGQIRHSDIRANNTSFEDENDNGFMNQHEEEGEDDL